MNALSRVATNRLALAMTTRTPAVALSFVDGEPDAALAAAVAAGVDVAELRIDRWSSVDADHVVAETQRFGNLATLATIRTSDEGGEWDGGDTARAAVFRAAMPFVDGIDIELAAAGALASVIEDARSAGLVVVLSFHDFESTPSTGRLDELIDRGVAAGADVVKVSALAGSPIDVRRLAEVTCRRADGGVITIAMGEHGSISRVMFGALGSLMTYCAGSHEVSGQLSVTETVALLDRFMPDRSRRG